MGTKEHTLCDNFIVSFLGDLILEELNFQVYSLGKKPFISEYRKSLSQMKQSRENEASVKPLQII